MRSLIVFIILGFTSQVFSQHFEISNLSKAKKLSSHDLFEFVLTNAEQDDKPCCSHMKMLAKIQEVSKDSVQLEMDFYYLKRDFRYDDKLTGIDLKEQGRNISIAQDHIISISPYKARKKKKILSFSAGALAIGGIVTAINSVIFTKGKYRRNLLIASGIQLAAGISLGTASVSKEYKFKYANDPWSFK